MDDKQITDEALMKEFLWAKGHIDDADVPGPEPDEWEKILRRIRDEREG